MSKRFKEETIQIGNIVTDLLDHPLQDKDKIAFHSHATEIEKMRDAGYPWNEWGWRKQILENYCKRTGINMKVLLRYVNSKYWLQIYKKLTDVKAI